jgi:hypothetical protein
VAMKFLEMIFMQNFKGAMWFDYSIDTFVHVSTCTSYNFNVLMPVVWKLWH